MEQTSGWRLVSFVRVSLWRLDAHYSFVAELMPGQDDTELVVSPATDRWGLGGILLWLVLKIDPYNFYERRQLQTERMALMARAVGAKRAHLVESLLCAPAASRPTVARIRATLHDSTASRETGALWRLFDEVDKKAQELVQSIALDNTRCTFSSQPSFERVQRLIARLR